VDANTSQSFKQRVEDKEIELEDAGLSPDNERAIQQLAPMQLGQHVATGQQQNVRIYKHDRDLELEFIEEWRSSWLIPAKGFRFPISYKKQPCWVPVRNATGKLEFRCSGPLGGNRSYENPREYKSWWYDVLHATWKRRSSPPQGKPPRWARVALEDGIKVLFDTNKTARVKDEDLDRFIDTVNETNKKERDLLEKQLEAAKSVKTKVDRDGSLLEQRRVQKDIGYFSKRKDETKWEVKRIRQVPDSKWLQVRGLVMFFIDSFLEDTLTSIALAFEQPVRPLLHLHLKERLESVYEEIGR